MTQEEKAKAYDRVSKEVKDFFEGRQKMYIDVTQTLEYLFPELKESEDERIRKAIINVFASHVDYEVFFGVSVKDILAWLEKQGEQKPADLPNGEDYGIDGLYHAISILEKTLGKVDGYQSDDGILEHKCAITAVKKLYNQKPAEWSEDDETVLSNLIWALKEDMVLAGDRDEYVSWLQSLKDKTIPQPKQEWSEEDDSMVEDVRNSFEFHCDEMTEALQEQYNKFFDKVKSLRPQLLWKPSDEQMDALESAVSLSQSTTLESLYNELKKL